MEKKELTKKCYRCNVPLEVKTAHFSYLDRTFNHPVPRCPVCGQVYIEKDLAKGKMSSVETSFEDK